MARSTYVYLLVSGTSSLIVHACFTVKHEAITFMGNMIKFDKLKLHTNLRLLRTGDNEYYSGDIVHTRSDLDD